MLLVLLSIPWWRHQMVAFSGLLALCTGNSLVTSEFPAQRPVTRSFDVFFDLRLNKRLNKHSWGWWFETPSRPLWRHCNENQRNSNDVFFLFCFAHGYFCMQQASQRLLYVTCWRVVHTEKPQSDWSFLWYMLDNMYRDRCRTFITLTSHEHHGVAKHAVASLLSQQGVDHAIL